MFLITLTLKIKLDKHKFIDNLLKIIIHKLID